MFASWAGSTDPGGRGRLGVCSIGAEHVRVAVEQLGARAWLPGSAEPIAIGDGDGDARHDQGHLGQGRPLGQHEPVTMGSSDTIRGRP
ncbi:hypothetical protein Aab01nite_04190 [Paractinoplanes abujensis]|uniref:Uncharacterized protein n=1 Tax=Paractinoplanes abujensis TaxID=882441 RepID=A0A7W7G0N2_9ACTN|nr:hypothetical protein [Actinoplanes abujensis]MBB4691749.1 hypothetical protein [Actinoplanes abujensis]GID16829.1 hypothetical protein Aab01nite_04190 [Actinoplanes abujensis]